MFDELKKYLDDLKPGPLEETSGLNRLLAGVWADLLGGDEGGMSDEKFNRRLEEVEWHPPVLSFVIERHGAAALGSSRAEPQWWAVDLDRRTATCARGGHRQLRPMESRVDVGPIADEIAGLIVSGGSDDRPRWLSDGRVRLEMGKILPERSGYKQTVQGRRRRLRDRLIEMLREKGWRYVGRNTFAKVDRAGPGFSRAGPLEPFLAHSERSSGRSVGPVPH